MMFIFKDDSWCLVLNALSDTCKTPGHERFIDSRWNRNVSFFLFCLLFVLFCFFNWERNRLSANDNCSYWSYTSRILFIDTIFRFTQVKIFVIPSLKNSWNHPKKVTPPKKNKTPFLEGVKLLNVFWPHDHLTWKTICHDLV